jgi:SsrA-binding protein
MAKRDKKKRRSSDDNPNERLVVENRKARHKYVVLETLECGIALLGSEVKSLRQGKISLDEAYGRVKNDEVWLVGCDIQEYSHANRMNHEPKRPRKLLLHRREIRKFAGQAFEKGLTIVPLKVYFKRGIAKVLVGICRGKKLYDKREQMKKDTVRREIDRAMRRR